MCNCEGKYKNEAHKMMGQRWELSANKVQYQGHFSTEYYHGRRYEFHGVSMRWTCCGFKKIDAWLKDSRPEKYIKDWTQDFLVRMEIDSEGNVKNFKPYHLGIKHLTQHEMNFTIDCSEIFSLIDKIAYEKMLVIDAKRITKYEDDFVRRLKQQTENSEEYLLCLILNADEKGNNDESLKPLWEQFKNDYKQIDKTIDKYVEDMREKIGALDIQYETVTH